MAYPPRRPRMDQPAPGFPVPSDPKSEPARTAAAREVAARKGALRDRILRDRRLTPSAKAVAFALIDFLSHETGWAWPGISKLAETACCDERTVRRSIRRLAELGYIVVIEGGGARRGEGDGRTNAYTIHWNGKFTDTLTEMSAISAVNRSAALSAPGSTGQIENYRAGMPRIADIQAPKYRAGMPGDSSHEKPLKDPAQRVRERTTGDGEGEVVAAAAPRVDQQVAQRPQPPAPSEIDRQRRHYAERRVRFGEWRWWERDTPDSVTRPPATVEPEVGEAIYSYQRGMAGWTVGSVAGARIIENREVSSRPTPAEVTVYAEALADGEADAVALADHFRILAEVEAEVQARHNDAYQELVITDRADSDLLDDLAAVDPGRRLGAEARAAALAAGWRRRSAGEPLAEDVAVVAPGFRRTAA